MVWLICALSATVLIAAGMRMRNGRFSTPRGSGGRRGGWAGSVAGAGSGVCSDSVDGDGDARHSDDGRRLSDEQIGAPLGERATLIQFSSSFCAPCRSTRILLADVAGKVDGVAFADIDAESHLDLVRELKILRTPTVLFLNDSGTIVERASGVPRKVDVIAALGRAIP